MSSFLPPRPAYEVLTEVDPSNSSIHWIRSESGRVPTFAVQGGYTSRGEPLYIGKIRLSSGVTCCGKVCAYVLKNITHTFRVIL